MCTADETKKYKFMMPAATLCLALGLMLRALTHPVSQLAKNWTDGVAGLLIGLSIGMNLMLAWKRRRKRQQALLR
jgi:predicted benzoate:H+ symporter BenE